MLIHITLAFTTEHIELRVERPHIHRMQANLLALERVASKSQRGPTLLAIGDGARRLAGAAEAIVKPVYDPDAFEPGLTAAGVGYYRNVLYQDVRPLIQMFTVGFLDRFRINLVMPRFERLPAEERDRFARSLGIVWMRSEGARQSAATPSAVVKHLRLLGTVISPSRVFSHAAGR